MFMNEDMIDWNTVKSSHTTLLPACLVKLSK